MSTLRFSRETLLIFGILVLAVAVRVFGVNFGLPNLYHADEPIVVNHAMAYGTGDLNPHFFKIPPLTSYLLFICYGIFYLLGSATGLFHSLRDFEYLFYFEPTLFYLIARVVFGVFLGTASAYVLYRLGKRFWDAELGLWAAFFLALNFLHARDSHYIYADIPLVFVFLLSMATIFKIPDFPLSLKLHGLIGISIGLATAVKYNGVFLAIPYLWICLRTVPAKKWPFFWFLAVLIAVLTFCVFNPYAVLDASFFLTQITEQSRANAGGFPFLHHLTYSLAGGVGWPMLFFALLGIIRSFWVRDPKQEACAIFVIGYYLVLCCWGQPHDRYVLVLTPFLLLLAVQVLLWVKSRSKLFFIFLIILGILPGFVKIVAWNQIMNAHDVRTVAKTWIERHIPSGSRIAMSHDFFMPRLAFSAIQIEEKKLLAQSQLQSQAKIRRLDAFLSKAYQPSYELYYLSDHPETQRFLFGEPQIPFDLSVLRQKGINYVMVVEPLFSLRDPFLMELRQNATRIMSFSPYKNPANKQIDDPQSLTGGPFFWKDMMARERNGYPIAVYELRH